MAAASGALALGCNGAAKTEGQNADEALSSEASPLTALNGIALNGLGPNGIAANGIALNGIMLNGIMLNGIALNGIMLNGIALNGIALNGIMLNGIALNGTTAPKFKTALSALAYCALPAGQSISVTDTNGAVLTYPGSQNLDPTWKTTAPTLSKSQVVAQCAMNRVASQGYTATFDANYAPSNFKLVMQYMIECALPQSVTVNMTDFNGALIPVRGSMGLAPEWQTGAPSANGQALVSACMAARTNAAGQHVQLSLRGPTMAAASALEKQQYKRYEGAFWGNLFSATPVMNTCEVDGGGMAGRMCTAGSNCGFTYKGACASVCTATDAAGDYATCSGASNVLSSYLPFESAVSGTGDSHAVCMRLLDSSARCWGQSALGTLGNSINDNLLYTTPQTVVTSPGAPLSRSMSVQVGDNFACSRQQNGTLNCWGSNGVGQLGNGTTTTSYVAARATSVAATAAQVSLGGEAACTVMTDGTISCWGNSSLGRLGNGSTVSAPQPTATKVIKQDGTNLTGAVRVAMGSAHGCALTTSGQIYCWGDNFSGQLGINSTTQQARATQVTSTSSFIDVFANGRVSCALDTAGGAWCWLSSTLGS